MQFDEHLEDNYDLESMYPDVYRMIHPHVQTVASKFDDAYLDDQALSAATSEVMRLSGFAEDAAPVMAAGRGRRNPNYHQSHHRGHGSFAPDLIRILLLRELMERRRRRRRW